MMPGPGAFFVAFPANLFTTQVPAVTMAQRIEHQLL
jgi:hypothetical protein